jgi:HEAT repeat protein
MIKKIFFILLAVLFMQHLTYAQTSTDQRTMTTRIADLLAQLPAKDAKQLNNNMSEITELGEDGYVTLISGLTGFGKGNNALLEYAIGGYSAYVSQTGKESERKMSVNAYCKALSKATDKSVKEFIISQLELTGKDDAIVCLKSYLTDAQLADPASRALVKINSSAAKAALLQALPTATGLAQLSIIEALGLSGTKEAVSALNILATNTDQNLARISLSALAHLADPSSSPVMKAAAEKTGYAYENTNATAANLLYAETLLKNGNATLAAVMAQQINEKATAANQIHLRTAALKILADQNKVQSTEILIKAMDDENIAYRAAALKFAVPYLNQATTVQWLAKLSKAKPENKAEIVSMLAKGNAKEALPKILKLLKSKDQNLKFAAIAAAAQLGEDQVLDDLYKVMRKGDAATVTAVTDAILRMKGKNITEKVAAYIPKSKSPVQIALVQILASRAANAQIGSIYSLLNDKNDSVKLAAYGALKKIAIQKDLPQLYNLLNESTDQMTSIQVQEAIIAAVKDSIDPAAQENHVLQQMATAPQDKKAYFYKVLASLGGPAALKAVVQSYATGDEQHKKAALTALAAWKNEGAIEELLKISRETKDPGTLNEALTGYLRLIRVSSFTDEQRYLKLREAITVAGTNEQKAVILRDLTQAKTFNSLVFAGKFLDDAALQQAAANTVMNIALSDPAFHGTTVRNLLNKTMSVKKGGDSEYELEAIRKFLAEMPVGEGFIPLFNGADLSGWQGLVADPIKRAKMDTKTLALAQEKANAEMLDSWKVENGELRFTSHGNNLATIKKYGDFEMLVDWKIIDDKKQNGDAGIYLRGTPQVQIWDNARVKDGAQVGSGGLYNNQVNESKPLKVADNKLDEWNTFRIIMKGDRVTVYLNGVLVTDNVILENYWDRSLPIFSEEQIELQAHGSPIAYRDIYIREIPRVKPFELSAKEKKEGFKILFDGSNMHQWTGNTTDYVIENGNMAIRPKPGKGSGGNLFTKDQYSDFVFRFEFQLTPGANNGLGIRAPLDGDAAYTGMELQILDNDAPVYKDLHKYQYHGSIYGTIAAKRGFLKPVGEWNYQEVIVKGPKIKVILNGTMILDADITDARKNGAADGKPHPGLSSNIGHIGFLGHGSPLQFRNIRIKDLSKK